jgi:hypothetical protein
MRRPEPTVSAWLGGRLRASATPWGAAPNPAFATWQPPGMIKPSPATARSVGSLHAVKRLSRHKRAARRPFIPRSAGQRCAPFGQDQRRQCEPVPLELTPALRSNDAQSRYCVTHCPRRRETGRKRAVWNWSPALELTEKEKHALSVRYFTLTYWSMGSRADASLDVPWHPEEHRRRATQRSKIQYFQFA